MPQPPSPQAPIHWIGGGGKKILATTSNPMNWNLSNHHQASPYRGLCQIEDIPKAPGNILNLIQRPKMRLTKKPSCAASPRTAICTSRCCSARWPSTKKCRPRPDCDSQSNHHSQTVMTGFWIGLQSVDRSKIQSSQFGLRSLVLLDQWKGIIVEAVDE